jgi:hypothetical protein
MKLPVPPFLKQELMRLLDSVDREEQPLEIANKSWMCGNIPARAAWHTPQAEWRVVC